MSESIGLAALAIYVTENIVPNKRTDDVRGPGMKVTSSSESSQNGEGQTKSGSSSRGRGMKGEGVLWGFPKLAPQFDGLNSFETFVST